MNGASGAAPSLPRLLTKHCVMAVILSALLIGGSGHWDWTRAWVYIATTLAIQMAAVMVLYRKSPDLLVERSRMQKGTKSWDKLLAPAVALLGPLAMWSVAAWDVRVHWPPAVPIAWSAAGLLMCVAGSLLTMRAMLENRFFSATVRLQSERGQVVVDSGPYRYVRHPGYSGAVAFTLATPFVLGSWAALIPAAATAILLVVRILLEEQTLRSELPGYSEYATRTRARLIPRVW